MVLEKQHPACLLLALEVIEEEYHAQMSQVCLTPSGKLRESQGCGPGAPVFLQPLTHYQQITFSQSFIFSEETKPSYKILKGEYSLMCTCMLSRSAVSDSDP